MSIVNSSYVSERFTLSQETEAYIKSLTPQFGFNGLGIAVYFRTYSRTMDNGVKETWPDTVLRVTKGVFSIRKDHMIKHHLSWNDNDWQEYAKEFATAMFKMEWLPPGRGLWCVGSDFVYNKGSAACNNCGATTMKDLIQGCCWMMDMLMCGVGVGADTVCESTILRPNKDEKYTYIIPDTREGWVEALRLLLRAYIPDINGKTERFPNFDFTEIRPVGVPIKGFGGISSGPAPLIKLLKRAEVFLDTYLDYTIYEKSLNRDNLYGKLADYTNEKNTEGMLNVISMLCDIELQKVSSPADIFENLVKRLRNEDYESLDDDAFEKFCIRVRESAERYPNEKKYNLTRLCIDLCNCIGICIVSGGVRRSSEIILGKPGDISLLEQ